MRGVRGLVGMNERVEEGKEQRGREAQEEISA